MLPFNPGSLRCLHRLTHRQGVGLLAVALLLASLAPLAQAQRVDPLAQLDRDQRRVFKNYTRLFCAQFFSYGEGRYVILPDHYAKRENSTGKSASQIREELTIIKKEKRGLTVVDVKYPPPDAEVIAAAKLLPLMEVGHYGYINKVKVREIVGPEEMIVSSIELIPENLVGTTRNAHRERLVSLQRTYQHQTYRLLGFRTKNLREGQEYMGPTNKGMQIAVMSTDPTHSFVLVNYKDLDRVRTSDFHKVLAYVKMSPLAFLDMVRDNRERLQSSGDKKSLISVYQRFYNRYRPSHVSSAPPTVRPVPPKVEPENPDPQDTDDGGSGYERTIPAKDPNDPADNGNEDPVDEPVTPDPVDNNEELEDDWDPDQDSSTGDVEFFGIPLGE